MFHIRQTSRVEEYVERLSELYDQLTTYEAEPNVVHYVTRFMEELTPSIRLMVGIQQPSDLDSAFALALLYEELGETSTSLGSSGSVSSNRRVAVQMSKVIQFRNAEDRKQVATVRPIATEDRWSALRAYRKSKGLCFTCGERWAKDHVCKQEVS